MERVWGNRLHLKVHILRMIKKNFPTNNKHRVETLGHKTIMRRYRIISQWVFGILFLLLFLNTRYMGEDVIPWPVNAFFTIDPLAGITAMAAGRKLIGFFWPILILSLIHI